MQVSISLFYSEVTGNQTPTTTTVRHALTRWNIPFSTSTREDSNKKFWKVDLGYMSLAKERYAAEVKAREDRKARDIKNKTNEQPEGFGLMERMANVEQALRDMSAAVNELLGKLK